MTEPLMVQPKGPLNDADEPTPLLVPAVGTPASRKTVKGSREGPGVGAGVTLPRADHDDEIVCSVSVGSTEGNATLEASEEKDCEIVLTVAVAAADTAASAVGSAEDEAVEDAVAEDEALAAVVVSVLTGHTPEAAMLSDAAEPA